MGGETRNYWGLRCGFGKGENECGLWWGVKEDCSVLGSLRKLVEGDCCLVENLKWQEDLQWREVGSSSWE